MITRRVEIIGGGLAGLSLGAALARAGIPTTVVEAGSYPRHRVCGEFIAGLSRDDVALLGLQPALREAVQHRSLAWFCGDRLIRREKLASPALGISRHTLDQRLADTFVQAGGVLKTNTRCDLSAFPTGRVLAAGRGVRQNGWVGLKMHVRGVALSADLEMHLGRFCYVGLCAVDDGWINVCGLFSRSAVSREGRENMLRRSLGAAGLPALQRRLNGGQIRAGSELATAGLGYEDPGFSGGVLRIGDAMTMIPPFTGLGMALAFRSAAKAVGPIRNWAAGTCSWARAVEEAGGAGAPAIRRRLRVARALHPWLQRPWRQRLFFAAHRAGILPVGTFMRLLHG